MNAKISDRITKNRNDLLIGDKKYIFFYETSFFDISSTKIRKIISKGENPVGLIPGSVWSYIKRNKLYSDNYE